MWYSLSVRVTLTIIYLLSSGGWRGGGAGGGKGKQRGKQGREFANTSVSTFAPNPRLFEAVVLGIGLKISICTTLNTRILKGQRSISHFPQTSVALVASGPPRPRCRVSCRREVLEGAFAQQAITMCWFRRHPTRRHKYKEHGRHSRPKIWRPLTQY